MAFLKKYGLIGGIIIAAIVVVYYVVENVSTNSATNSANQQNAAAQATLQADQEQEALGSLGAGGGGSSVLSSQPTSPPITSVSAPAITPQGATSFSPTTLTSTGTETSTGTGSTPQTSGYQGQQPVSGASPYTFAPLMPGQGIDIAGQVINNYQPANSELGSTTSQTTDETASSPSSVLSGLMSNVIKTGASGNSVAPTPPVSTRNPITTLFGSGGNVNPSQATSIQGTSAPGTVLSYTTANTNPQVQSSDGTPGSVTLLTPAGAAAQNANPIYKIPTGLQASNNAASESYMSAHTKTGNEI